jgi:hypothetical protein
VVAGAIGGIMGSVGLGGVASFLGMFWMNGALVGKQARTFCENNTMEANTRRRDTVWSIRREDDGESVDILWTISTGN